MGWRNMCRGKLVFHNDFEREKLVVGISLRVI